MYVAIPHRSTCLTIARSRKSRTGSSDARVTLSRVSSQTRPHEGWQAAKYDEWLKAQEGVSDGANLAAGTTESPVTSKRLRIVTALERRRNVSRLDRQQQQPLPRGIIGRVNAMAPYGDSESIEASGSLEQPAMSSVPT